MAKYRTIKASLKKSTPLLWQTEKSNGYPVGCGNLAWAIVLGYWKQYNGKSKLLDDINMLHVDRSKLHKHMEELAKDNETTYGSYKGSKYGRTAPWKMDKVKKYIKRCGYKSSVERDRGTEFSKFHKVRASLVKDRPVIILMNDPKKAFSSLHYAIIEEAELKQKRVARKWRNRDVRYKVNKGHYGKKPEWIWVREVGRNTHKHTGSFSMFHLNIT